jgi:solute carrier family 26 (sodium-independent sulfate anion transporter), member 11
VDTRNEIERWANQPVEFHFATILSPWIRRALVAGGFGSSPLSSAPTPREIASVVAYAGGYQERAPKGPHNDVETGDVKQGSSASSIVNSDLLSYGATSGDRLSAMQIDTPFFHFDLQGAVRAAENGLLRRTAVEDDLKHPLSP